MATLAELHLLFGMVGLAVGVGYVEYLVSGINVEVPEDWFLRLARSWLESPGLRMLSYKLALICLFVFSNLVVGIAGLVVARRRATRNRQTLVGFGVASAGVAAVVLGTATPAFWMLEALTEGDLPPDLVVTALVFATGGWALAGLSALVVSGARRSEKTAHAAP